MKYRADFKIIRKINKSSLINYVVNPRGIRFEPPIDAKLHPYKQSRAGSVEG